MRQLKEGKPWVADEEWVFCLIVAGMDLAILKGFLYKEIESMRT